MTKFNSRLPKLWLKINRVSYGRNLRLGGWPMIFRFRSAKLSIGNDCSINSNFLSNLLGLYQRTIIVARDEGEIKIGNHVGISGSTLYAREKIEVGDDCVIGANCKIMDNDFHSLDPEERRMDIYDNLPTREVILGRNVFIGCNCILLKGTRLGDDCIVGAGSVVSGEFPARAVIAGNPARIVKMQEDCQEKNSQEGD